MTDGILLRDVQEDDLSVFFDQQLDPDANEMAAFTAKDPADRDAFLVKWAKILADQEITVKTIVFDGEVAGNVLLWKDESLDAPEVSYWIGRQYWGRGLATKALSQFLTLVETRPLYGRTAKDNVASMRVLEKCGFIMSGKDLGFANARGEEIEELIFKLATDPTR